MTLNDAIAYVKTNMIGLVNEIEFTLDSPYSDISMLGEFIISQVCSDATVTYNTADYIWYNIAGYTVTQGTTPNSIKIYMNYYDTSNMSETYTFIENLVNSLGILSMTIPNAIKSIYDWISTNVSYDSTMKTVTWYTPTGTGTNNIAKNGLDDVFINKKSVCQGISRAMYYIINKYITPCRIIQGNEWYNRGLYYHCWNIAEYENLWYNIDATAGVHQYEDDSTSDYSQWLMKNAVDFNNTTRTKYIPLPNYMRSEWYNKFAMSPTSYSY